MAAEEESSTQDEQMKYKEPCHAEQIYKAVENMK
jgi:hypothetical protein